MKRLKTGKCRSSLGTKGECHSLSLWCRERYRHRKAIPQFALSTEPDLAATCWVFSLQMHRRWVCRSRAPQAPSQAACWRRQGSVGRANSFWMILKVWAAAGAGDRPGCGQHAGRLRGRPAPVRTAGSTEKGPGEGAWALLFLFFLFFTYYCYLRVEVFKLTHLHMGILGAVRK